MTDIQQPREEYVANLQRECASLIDENKRLREQVQHEIKVGSEAEEEIERLRAALQEAYEQLWHLAKDPETNALLLKLKEHLRAENQRKGDLV